MEIFLAPFSDSIFLTLRRVLGVTTEITFDLICELEEGFGKSNVWKQINTAYNLERKNSGS